MPELNFNLQNRLSVGSEPIPERQESNNERSLLDRVVVSTDDLFQIPEGSKITGEILPRQYVRESPEEQEIEFAKALQGRLQLQIPEKKLKWTDDPEKLRRLSYLQYEEISENTHTKEEIQDLFDLAGVSRSPIDRLQSLLNSLIRKRHPINNTVAEAVKREERLLAIQKKGCASDNRAAAENELRRFSEELAKEICQMDHDPFLLFGACGNGGSIWKDSIRKWTSKALPLQLAQPLQQGKVKEKMDHLVSTFAVEILEQLKIEKIPKALLTEIRKVFEQGLWKAEAPRILQKLMPGFLEKRLPAFLRMALKEEMMHSIPEGRPREEGELFYRKLCDEGFENALRDFVMGHVDGVEEQLHQQVNGMMREFSSYLPPTGVEVLSCFGISELERPVWYELVPHSDKTVSVVIHQSGSSYAFRNVSRDRLDRDFFHTLLSFRVRPRWESQISYTEHDLRVAVEELLGVEPTSILTTSKDLARNFIEGYLQVDSVEAKSPPIVLRQKAKGSHKNALPAFSSMMNRREMINPRKNVLSTSGLVSLTASQSKITPITSSRILLTGLAPAAAKQKDFWAQRIEKCERRKDRYEDLLLQSRMKALAALWKENSHESNLAPAANTLIGHALTLYEKKNIDLGLLKGIYAAWWEVDQLSRRVAPPPPASNTLLPPMISAQLGGLSEHTQTVKDLLEAAFGTEMTGIIDDVLKEVGESNEIIEIKAADNASVPVIQYSFRDRIEQIIEGVLDRVWTLLFLAGSALLQIIIYGVSPTTVAVSVATSLIARYHPTLIAAVCPKPILKAYLDATRWLQKQMMTAACSILAKTLLSDETIAIVNQNARHYQQQITRSGAISYDLIGREKSSELKSITLPMSGRRVAEAASRAVSSAKIVALPSKLKRISIASLKTDLEDAIASIKSYYTHDKKKYLIEFMWSLEVPNRSEDCFWNQVEKPEEIMSLLAELLMCVVTAHPEAPGEITPAKIEKNSQLAIALFHLQCITTHLAFRCPELKLEGFSIEGWELAYWLHSPFNVLSSANSNEILKKLCAYYHLDLKKAYNYIDLKRLNQKSLLSYYSFSLGPLFSHKGLFPSFVSPDFAYLKRFVDQSELKKSDLDHSEYVMGLFIDPISDKNKRIMPHTFHLLRLVTFASRHMLSEGSWSWIQPQPSLVEYELIKPFEIERGTIDRLFDVFPEVESQFTALSQMPFDFPDSLFFKDIDLDKALVSGENLRYLNSVRYSEGFDDSGLARPVNQNEIIYHPRPLKSAIFKALPLQSRRILEMVRSEKPDQLIRAFSFFNDNLNLLTQREYLKLFEVFILQAGLLQEQLLERPEIYSGFARFFERAIFYHKEAENQSLVCELIRLAAIVREMRPQERAQFINLEREVATIVQSNPAIAHTTANDLFAVLDCETACPELLVRVAELRFYLARYRISSYLPRANQWTLETRQLLDRDPKLRESLLERLLEAPSSGDWEGSYPCYQKGETTIDLLGEDVDYVKSDNPIQTEAIRFIQVCLGMTGKIELSPVGDDRFNIPGRSEWVSVTRQDEGYVDLHLIREYEGKEYVVLPKNYAPDGAQAWMIERNGKEGMHRVIFLKDDKAFKAEYLSGEENGTSTVVREAWIIDGEELEEVDLAKCTHGLGLLSWFVPLNEMKIYSFPENPGSIKRIEMNSFGLVFEVNAAKQAMCKGSLAGFFISKEQKHPAMHLYTNYLLLENDRGEKKVMIPTMELNKEFLSQGIKSVPNMPNCQLLDMAVQSLGRGAAEPSKFYLYDLSEAGNLESEDPEALAHLMLTQFVRGQKQTAKLILEKLETICRRKAFSREVLEIFDRMNLFFFAQNTREGRLICLRFAILREENALMQKKPENSTEWNWIWWVTTQLSYKNYLDEIQQGAQQQLSEFQELFLLKAISRHTGKKVKSFFADQKNNKYVRFGRGLMETMLMIPCLSERYRTLRGKHAEWGEDEVGNTEIFASQFLQSQQSVQGPKSEQVQVTPVPNDVIIKMARFISYPLLNSLSLDQVTTALRKLTPYRTRACRLDPSRVIPDDFKLRFFDYYRLAKRELREECIGDPVKQQEFYRDAARLKKLISVTRGKFEPSTQFLIEILRLVASSSFPKSFPMVKELIDAAENTILVGSSHSEIQAQTLKHTKTFKKLISSCKRALISQKFPQDMALSFAGNTAKHVIQKKALSYFIRSSGLGAAFSAFETARSFVGPAKTGAKFALQKFQWSKSQDSYSSDASVKDNFLPGSLAMHLKELDASAGSVLKQICEKHLSAKPSPVGTSKKTLGLALQRLNVCLTDYHERKVPGKYHYEYRETERIYSDLKVLADRLQAQLEESQSQLLAFANQYYDQTNGEDIILMRQALIKSKIPSESLEWNAICRFFLIGDIQGLCSQTSLSSEEARQLEQGLYEHHLLLTRYQQTERALQSAAALDQLSEGQESKRELLLSQLGEELSRDRAYDLNGNARLLRAFLLFESRSQKMLWEKQVRQISRLLDGSQTDAVVELIMGSGKTYFGIPTTDFFEADGTQAVVNIWPAPVVETNIEQVGRQSKEVFGQFANAKRFTRGKGFSSNQMWAFLKVLTRSIAEGEHLNMTKEDAQALELNFIEQLYLHAHPQLKKKHFQPKSIEFMRKALFWLRTRGRASVDEAHEIFSRKKELNYPLGRPMKLKSEFVDVADACIKVLMRPQMIEILNVRENRQNEMTQEQYEKLVLPFAAKRLCEKLGMLKIAKEDVNEVVGYLCDPEKNPPECVQSSPKRSEIALVKGILLSVLPNALQRVVNVNYGPSKKSETQEYAIPYAGNDNPLENSTIRNPVEALIKTQLMFLHRRLTVRQTTRLVKWLQERGKTEAKKTGIPIERTKAARLFAKMTKEENCPNGHKLFASNLDYSALHKLLSGCDEAVLLYVHKLVAPQIKYFATNIRSDSHNFASMFAHCYGDTGTPYNHETFPLGMKVLWDKGTTGETLDILLQKCEAADRVKMLQAETPKETLSEILDAHYKPNQMMRALIDCGALLRGMSTTEVARQLMAFIEDNRPDLKGVVYYEAGELVILEKGSHKAIPLRESALRPEERMTYYDQPHTFASDIPQGMHAEAVVTVGEQLTLEGGLAQAVWRMRGLKTQEQGLLFVIPQKVRPLLGGETIQHIIAFTEKNEQRQLAEDNYLADRQKIANIARRAALDRILHAKSFSQAVKLFQRCQKFLIDAPSDDPYEIYGHAQISENPVKALQQYKDATLERLKGFIAREEYEQCEKRMSQIGSTLYPEKVSQRDDLDKEQECEQENEQELEQDTDLHRELEQDLQKQNQMQPIYGRAPKHQEWRNMGDIDLSSTNWMKGKASGVPIFPLKDALRASSHPAIRAIAPHMSERILCSNNFLTRILDDIDADLVEPAGPFQKPVLEMLVVQENSIVTLILLDAKDGNYWRRRLAKDREEGCQSPKIQIGLYDLGLRSFVATGAKRFEEEELHKKGLFIRQEMQVKFFNGDVEYQEDQLRALSSWAHKIGVESLEMAFEAIFESMKHETYDGSVLENFFLSQKEMLDTNI